MSLANTERILLQVAVNEEKDDELEETSVENCRFHGKQVYRPVVITHNMVCTLAPILKHFSHGLTPREPCDAKLWLNLLSVFLLRMGYVNLFPAISVCLYSSIVMTQPTYPTWNTAGGHRPQLALSLKASVLVVPMLHAPNILISPPSKLAELLLHFCLPLNW